MCEQASIEEQKHECNSKITEVLGNVATHAPDRLNNLAYVFRGVDMVVASPWLKDCSPQEKEWLYIIEATEQAKFDSQERQDTEDLSLTSLKMFHKPPATTAIQGVQPTKRMNQLRQVLDKICPRAARA